jgi:hypothetical protein
MHSMLLPDVVETSRGRVGYGSRRSRRSRERAEQQAKSSDEDQVRRTARLQ